MMIDSDAASSLPISHNNAQDIRSPVFPRSPENTHRAQLQNQHLMLLKSRLPYGFTGESLSLGLNSFQSSSEGAWVHVSSSATKIARCDTEMDSRQTPTSRKKGPTSQRVLGTPDISAFQEALNTLCQLQVLTPKAPTLDLKHSTETTTDAAFPIAERPRLNPQDALPSRV